MLAKNNFLSLKLLEWSQKTKNRTKTFGLSTKNKFLGLKLLEWSQKTKK